MKVLISVFPKCEFFEKSNLGEISLKFNLYFMFFVLQPLLPCFCTNLLRKKRWHMMFGMAWHGMAWHGIAWHGMAWHGMAWHGMAWHIRPPTCTPAGPPHPPGSRGNLTLPTPTGQNIFNDFYEGKVV